MDIRVVGFGRWGACALGRESCVLCRAEAGMVGGEVRRSVEKDDSGLV